MKTKVNTTVKKVYKGFLLGVLTVLAFVLKVQNPEAPEKLMEPAFADVPYPESPADCPSPSSGDCR